ncbi:hypothetical protein JZ751_030021, partial [Albula glossodonta]
METGAVPKGGMDKRVANLWFCGMLKGRYPTRRSEGQVSDSQSKHTLTSQTLQLFQRRLSRDCLMHY